MGSKPSAAGGTRNTSIVRRDTPVPVIAIALAAALVALTGLALFSPLRDRLIAPPPPARMPSTSMPSTSMPPSAPPASVPVQAEPVPPPAPVVETPLTLVPATPAQTTPPPAPATPALTGEAALIEALRTGHISLASGGDLSRWTLRWSEANGRGVPQSFLDHMRVMKIYLIRKDFTIPDGLSGAHSVIFILDRHVPHPRGKPGHSAILDMSSGACTGPACHYLSER